MIIHFSLLQIYGIICSFLEMDESEITEINVTNPISLSDDVNAKEMILDIKAILNDTYITNLEMQVINNNDWPERSLTYLCRCFDNLQKGELFTCEKCNPYRISGLHAFSGIP